MLTMFPLLDLLHALSFDFLYALSSSYPQSLTKQELVAPPLDDSVWSPPNNTTPTEGVVVVDLVKEETQGQDSNSKSHHYMYLKVCVTS